MIGKTIKKLLLEEKAKAYDEALEKARTWYVDAQVDFKKSLEALFPVLKEDEDEKTRKDIITFIKSVAYAKTDDVKRYVAWLEKQGKPVSDSGSDPVATKFHVQDWITDGYRTERVLDIKGPDYILQSQDGDTTCYDPISYVDPRYHLWTIQDVRPGDILIDDFGIYVFGEPDDLDNTAYRCSCAYQYSDKKFEYTSMICNLSGASLASKDQCEDFFSKMKDTGYEWDPDEKRPIENKKKDDPDPPLLMYVGNKSGTPYWDQNDEDMLTGISAYVCSPDGFQEWYDWLQSLKGRIRMQGWKDYDKEMLKAAISYVEHCTFTAIGKGKLATIAWLKSLENKVWPEQVWDIDDEHNLQGIIDEIKANKSEAAGHEAGTYDRFLGFLESLRYRVGKSSYDPYKVVVGSILEMCDKYESRIEDKESARDFLNNVRVKCKDADEYDQNHNRAK